MSTAFINPADSQPAYLLKAENISIASSSRQDLDPDGLVVRSASFELLRGAALGIAGESGSGKTALIHSLLGYVRPGLHPVGGNVRLNGCVLPLQQADVFAGLRGRVISLVPQSANAMLNPIMTVGAQLTEIYRTVVGLRDRAQTRKRMYEMLGGVGFADPAAVAVRYPHQLSGGQRQRVALCLALIPNPDVLVLDESTTDLDVITQELVLRLILDLKQRHNFALVAVSHDLRVLAALCTHLLVMVKGQVVETGPLQTVLSRPAHPYTAQLVSRFANGPLVPLSPGGNAEMGRTDGGCAYRPQCPLSADRCSQEPDLLVLPEGRFARCWFASEALTHTGANSLRILVPDQLPTTAAGPGADSRTQSNSEAPILRVVGLRAAHRAPGLFGRKVEVLKNIHLEVNRGETLGIVGESGSGKSTFARVLAGLHPPNSGQVLYNGLSLAIPARSRPVQLRRAVQIIFQNPDSALNPKLTVGDILLRRVQLFEQLPPVRARQRVEELLETVGLAPDYAKRRSPQLSGGEKQRVAIARALAGEPELVICDEIVSSLDVVSQARIMQLLDRLQKERKLTYLFISHDLSIVAAIAHRIAVFKDGTLCEYGPAAEVLAHSRDPYTRRLVASAFVQREQNQSIAPSIPTGNRDAAFERG